MHADMDVLAGLLLHDADELAIEVRPSHAADIAATLPRVEQERERGRELGRCAVDETLTDALRPRETRACVITALASSGWVASCAVDETLTDALRPRETRACVITALASSGWVASTGASSARPFSPVSVHHAIAVDRKPRAVRSV